MSFLKEIVAMLHGPEAIDAELAFVNKGSLGIKIIEKNLVDFFQQYGFTPDIDNIKIEEHDVSIPLIPQFSGKTNFSSKQLEHLKNEFKDIPIVNFNYNEDTGIFTIEFRTPVEIDRSFARNI